MAVLKKLILPVKSGTGTVPQEYDLPTPVNLGFGYGVCETAYIMSEKVVTITDFELVKYGIVCVTFENDVASSATLNINDLGAKAIYHRGAAIANNIIFAGDTVTFMYDGSHFNLISLDRTPRVDYKTVIL